MYVAVDCTGNWEKPHCGSIQISEIIWKSPELSASSTLISPSAVPKMYTNLLSKKYFLSNNYIYAFSFVIDILINNKASKMHRFQKLMEKQSAVYRLFLHKMYL